MKTHTNGNIIVEDIKVGDIHYEFDYNMGIEVKVITEPKRNDEGVWIWKSEKVNNGKIINYAVTEDLSHYSPKLYDYKAYKVKQWI